MPQIRRFNLIQLKAVVEKLRDGLRQSSALGTLQARTLVFVVAFGLFIKE